MKFMDRHPSQPCGSIDLKIIALQTQKGLVFAEDGEPRYIDSRRYSPPRKASAGFNAGIQLAGNDQGKAMLMKNRS